MAPWKTSFRFSCFIVFLYIPFSIQNEGFRGFGFDSEFRSASGKILIKGGTVVNAHHKEVADVYIEDGIIVSVRHNIKVSDDVTILDATGKYVMPGGIDPHTHLEMDFMGTQTIDNYFTGQAAALAGGTTMHIDFVIPVDGSLSTGFDVYVEKAKKSIMDYGFHMAITKWDETVSKEMAIMVKENGVNSFKFFMAYKGSLMINDDLLLEGFERCKSLGALAMVHAENGDGVAKGQQNMMDLGITGPEGHALSRPPVGNQVRGSNSPERPMCLNIEGESQDIQVVAYLEPDLEKQFTWVKDRGADNKHECGVQWRSAQEVDQGRMPQMQQSRMLCRQPALSLGQGERDEYDLAIYI